MAKSREQLEKELAQEMANRETQPSVSDLLGMILDLREENQRLSEDVNEVRENDEQTLSEIIGDPEDGPEGEGD